MTIKTFTSKVLPFLALLLLAGVAHADGNCPPGYYQVGGLGTSGCNPIPGYNQQQAARRRLMPPPEQWASQWGAIAVYPRGAVLGISINKATRQEAEQAALEDCESRGGKGLCKVDQSYANQCVAFTAGDTGHNSNVGATIDQAAKKGMEVCMQAGDTHCSTVYTACSYPVRIQ